MILIPLCGRLWSIVKYHYQAESSKTYYKVRIQKEPTVESEKGISCQCSRDKSIYSGLILNWQVIHNTFCHEREMKEWEWQAEPNSFFARIPHNFFVSFISTLSASSFLKIFSHFGRCSKLSIPFLLLLPGFPLIVVSGGYCLLWNMSYSYCSWGSQGKNTEVVCHSLLQWTMFCENSPPWPIHLGWPYMAWLIVSLS